MMSGVPFDVRTRVDGDEEPLELATLNWVWWFNEIRLHGEIGYVPPVELEQRYYRQMNSQQQPLLGEPSLH